MLTACPPGCGHAEIDWDAFVGAVGSSRDPPPVSADASTATVERCAPMDDAVTVPRESRAVAPFIVERSRIAIHRGSSRRKVDIFDHRLFKRGRSQLGQCLLLRSLPRGRGRHASSGNSAHMSYRDGHVPAPGDAHRARDEQGAIRAMFLGDQVDAAFGCQSFDRNKEAIKILPEDRGSSTHEVADIVQA